MSKEDGIRFFKGIGNAFLITVAMFAIVFSCSCNVVKTSELDTIQVLDSLYSIKLSKLDSTITANRLREDSLINRLMVLNEMKFYHEIYIQHTGDLSLKNFTQLHDAWKATQYKKEFTQFIDDSKK